MLLLHLCLIYTTGVHVSIIRILPDIDLTTRLVYMYKLCYRHSTLPHYVIHIFHIRSGGKTVSEHSTKVVEPCNRSFSILNYGVVCIHLSGKSWRISFHGSAACMESRGSTE